MKEPYADLYLFVDGKKIGPEERETRPVLNPATGRTIGRVPMATPEDLERALGGAQRAFQEWRRVPAYERADIMRQAASTVRQRADEIARLLTLEEGKVRSDARLEVLAAADAILWSAEEGRRAYGRVIPSRAAGLRSMVTREPIGPVAVFTPWNFPVSMPARKIAPALAAGCSCIIKAAEETPASCLAIVEAFVEAGVPAGVLSAVFGNPAAVSSHLINSPIVRKVSFTGSIPVGRQIAHLAAAGPKPATLELGGHAPVLVLEDADVATTVATSVVSKFRNAGQICTSPTRFVVHRAQYDEFIERFAAAASRLKVGDGMDATVQMGPLANGRRIEAMERLIGDARDKGARVLCGGGVRTGEGFFFMPTVLADVPATAEIASSEPFGPVAVISRVNDDEQAIREANRLPYGLAAYLFSAAGGSRADLIDRIEAGIVGVNTFAVSAAETPFGGVKDSGYGSEGGQEGLDAYLVTKYIATA